MQSYKITTRLNLILLITAFTTICSKSQEINPAILKYQWNGSWITVPGASPEGYGIYLFRKDFNLKSKPASYVIHISADNRYKLFVNGKLASLGPARGDIDHWNFETIDIASFLNPGKNVLAAVVWNHGEWRAEFQVTLRTAFIIQGDGGISETTNTNNTWKCIRDSSIHPIKVSMRTYYVAGPGEEVNMHSYPKGWEKIDYPDSLWKNAKIISKGTPRNMVGPFTLTDGWMLVPSSIPQMEMKPQRMQQLKSTSGIKIPKAFPKEKSTFVVPAHTIATLLLDQSFLTNAYPQVSFSKGRNASISLTYAEALFTTYPEKGNRNETEGKIIIGRKDSIISDGTLNQEFIPLTWRTFRYIQLRIVTKDEPLTFHDISSTFTGYPFQLNASLKSDNNEISKILEIGWRTARLDAMETYMDCPYYEQLQYIGDTRIQGLVSLYNSGDDRLLKNAINLIDQSRMPEGLTESRHPSFTTQYIPTFSLWYIGMLHDYWMYGSDMDFIKSKLPGMRMVLNYFKGFQLPDGSLRDVPFWMFTDWVENKNWVAGVGPIGKNGTSSLLDFQLLWAYQLAADMENKIGLKDLADIYNANAKQLKETIIKKYWDSNKKLFADREEKDLFSQHANTLAILTETVKDGDMENFVTSLQKDTSLSQASIYFKYYLHRALIKAGHGDDYLSWLDIWRDNIKMGLTTWAEISNINAARSDCHAWGASPNIELYRTVLGIDSDAPGFSKVRIEPHLGSITNIEGEIPHPAGKIVVHYHYSNNKWKFEINLPASVSGTFIWKGKAVELN
jgi:alpha-L-rhamnosidase